MRPWHFSMRPGITLACEITLYVRSQELLLSRFLQTYAYSIRSDKTAVFSWFELVITIESIKISNIAIRKYSTWWYESSFCWLCLRRERYAGRRFPSLVGADLLRSWVYSSRYRKNNYFHRFSCSRSHIFLSSPHPYPTSFPLFPMTRWQGMMMTMGFAWFAPQIARTALGFAIIVASSR